MFSGKRGAAYDGFERKSSLNLRIKVIFEREKGKYTKDKTVITIIIR
jgi:hypothetical protein